MSPKYDTTLIIAEFIKALKHEKRPRHVRRGTCIKQYNLMRIAEILVAFQKLCADAGRNFFE